MEWPGTIGPADIDGLLVVVIGDGTLLMPVDFTLRRSDPEGIGRPCATH